MKKIVNILAIALPVLAAIIFIVLFIASSSNLGSTRQNLAALQATSTSAINSKDQTLAAKGTEAASTLAKSVGELQATNAMMETQKKGLLDTYTSAQISLDDLEKSLLCRTQLNKVDFSSNATVSKALVELVGDMDGSTLSASWDVVWGNARTAIHKIRGEYLWVFVVAFNDVEMGSKNSIFSLSGMCFVFRSTA